MEKVTPKTVYFCTYKNKSTNYQWAKSKEYDSATALVSAMVPYINENPMTTVQYQTTTKYCAQQ